MTWSITPWSARSNISALVMANWRPEIEGMNIVLIGNFNPKIFQPSWFDHHGLIRREEAEEAENLVSVPQLTTFTAAWLTLQVTNERFQASTVDPAHYEALRDLVLGSFALLEHTPLHQMGINKDMHFRLREDRYVQFGHFLLPKHPWEGVLSDPRTRSLTVQGTQTRDSQQVKIFVKVESSIRIEFGVFINTNEHYEASGEASGRKLMSLLGDNWSEAQQASSLIADHLLSQEF
jgi:hypothetical protein